MRIAVSADGRQVAAVPLDGLPALFPVEGGEPRAIPGGLPGDLPTAFSGDGRFLVVTADHPPGKRLDRIDLVTGERTVWTELLPADRAGLLDVAWVCAAPDAGAYVYSYRRVLSVIYMVEGLR